MDLEAGVTLVTHALSTQFRDIERFARKIGGGQSSAIVMAPLAWAYPVAALTGYNVVGVPNNVPIMPDFQDRANAVARFYDAATSPGNRRDIVRRFDVDYILIENGVIEVPLDEEWIVAVRGNRFSFFTARIE